MPHSVSQVPLQLQEEGATVGTAVAVTIGARIDTVPDLLPDSQAKTDTSRTIGNNTAAILVIFKPILLLIPMYRGQSLF